MQENQISHMFRTFLLLTEEDMASCSRTLIENAILKSIRAKTKWSVKKFLEWQNGRKNKNPAIEPLRLGSCVVCEPLDRYVGRHLDRHIGRYVGRHIDRRSIEMSVDIATDISVEGCWSSIGRYVDRYVHRYVGRYVDRCSTYTSVDIAADIRPIR